MLFSSLKKYPYIRKSLSSINSARANIYSSSFFGKSKWYSEEFDFLSGPLSSVDRRKFRFCLKSNVEFLLQLDLNILKDLLIEQDPKIVNFKQQVQSHSHAARFSDGSCLDLLNLANPGKSEMLCTILARLRSNLHFSQTMNEYMALDDKIEPAKMVVVEAIKNGPNLGSVLRGGSFASCAQVYRHLASRFDYDGAADRYDRRANAARRGHVRRNRGSPTSRPYSRPRYPLGYCYNFQETGSCKFGNACTYVHKCGRCLSESHGMNSCPTQARSSIDVN